MVLLKEVAQQLQFTDWPLWFLLPPLQADDHCTVSDDNGGQHPGNSHLHLRTAPIRANHGRNEHFLVDARHCI